MRLLKEKESVSAVVWFTFVKGYRTHSDDELISFSDVIVSRTTRDGAQAYLRKKYNDRRLVITAIEQERTIWKCPLSEFLAIADNVDGKYLDVKEI